MGLGMGTAMLPLLTIAMSGVPERDAGLASGIVNVSMQLAGALGIAVLGTLATDRTEALGAAGAAPLSALTGGYHLAFEIAAASVAVGIVVALLVLRTAAARAGAVRARPGGLTAAAARPPRARRSGRRRRTRSASPPVRPRGRPSASRPRPRSRHQVRKPPPNASPAPIVSTTSIFGAATRSSAPAVTTSAPSPPRVTSATLGPSSSSAAGRLDGRSARREVLEIVLADLDDVRVAQRRGEAAAKRALVRDERRPAVRVDHHQRALGDRLDDRLQRERRRLHDQAERADVQHVHPLRQRRERGRGLERGRARGLGVEAVGGHAVRVELGQRERRRQRRVDHRVEPHAVLHELRAQLRAEAVVGQTAEEVHVLLEPAERARGVVRAASRVRAQLPFGMRHEVHERLASDHDRAPIRHGREPYAL